MGTKFILSDEEKEKAKAYLKQISELKKENTKSSKASVEQLPTVKTVSDTRSLPIYNKTNDSIISSPALYSTRTKKAQKEIDKFNGNTWFSAGDFSDGYQFGDITKSTLGTVGDIGVNAVKGVSRLGEGMLDLLGYGAAGVADLIGFDDTAEIMRNNLQKSQTDETFKSADDFIDKHSFLGEKGDSATQGVGYIVPIIATGGALGAAGVGSAAITAGTSALTGLSSMGSGMSEAYQGGATDGEALMYGLISGATTAGTELIFGGLGKAVKALGFSKGLSSLDDAFARKIQSKISNTLGKNLVGYGIKAGAEGTEEVIEGLLNAIGKKMTYMSDEELVKIIEDENLLDQFISGAIVSGIAQTPSLVKTTNASRDIITGYTQSEQKVIDTEIENRINEQQKITNKKLSNKEITQIKKEVENDFKQGYIKAVTEEAEEQQITQVENNIAQNQNMEQNTYNAEQQVKIDSENFAKQVDAVKNGTFPSEDMLTLGNTPKILQELGMRNLPITMTQKHLETISQKSGKYTNSNYHDLGIDTVKQLPEAIANPLNVLKSHNNSYVVITSLADKQGQIVIASIRIDGKGFVNNIQIDSNVLTSAYGRKNYDDYMRKNIQAGNLIYDIDEGIIKENLNITNNPRLQLPNDISNSVPNNIISQNEQNMQVQDNIDTYNKRSSNAGYRLQLPSSNITTSSINNSIAQTNKNVKGDTIINNSMQNSGNNTQNIKKQQAPSISNNFAETSNKANSWSNQQINNIANNQQTLYNNNESESGINENRQRAMGGSIEHNGVIKNNVETEYSKEGFKEFEKRARSQTKRTEELSNNEIDLKNKYEKEVHKEIRFFNGDINDMPAFASETESGVIFINSNNYEKFEDNKLIYHETLESEIAHNKEIRNVAKQVIDIIRSDDSFKNNTQIDAFYEGIDNRTTDNTYAIAKDILCDMYNTFKTGEELEYKNLLDIDTNLIITDALEKIDNIINQNSTQSSFSMSNEELVEAPSIANNVAETGEYTKQKESKLEQEKVAEILEQPIEKVKEKDRTWAILKANLVDKGIVFEELSHKTNNRELQGKWDYTLTATARGQNAIGNARYEMDSKNKTQKQISKSLEDIKTEVGNKTAEFQNYMYHQLNIDRMTLEERFSGDTGINYERKNVVKNKPVFGNSVTAEISQKIVNEYEQKYPQFKEWAQDVYDFNNANKHELVKNGVISQELSDIFSEIYPHYVPIKRVDAKGNAIKVPLDTNRTGVNTPIARATGGSSNIQPLFQTMADRTLQTYRASARNSFGVELMNTLNSIQETQQTDIDTILEEIGDVDNDNELLKEGKNGNAPTFTVFNNGEKVTFEITNDMFDALKPQSQIITNLNNSKIFKGLNKISNFRRGVLTEYNPIFAIMSNPIKDIQEVVLNSQHPIKTYSKIPEAYAQIIKKGYWYNEYVQNGGEQNSYFKDGDFESNKKVNKAKKALTIPLEKISSFNSVIEIAPRLAEYIASREKGTSIETSMLDASRVTTNFKAGGDIVKFANRNGFTFLNASVQGAAQQIRNITEANAKGLKGYAVLATKYAIAGLPALILNNMVWDDDEDYDDLQDYVKDNYYIIGKYGDGKFIRIPKGRTVAVIQKLVNNVSEYVTKDKELNIDNFAKDFWENIKFTTDNLAPNNPLDNNILSPILQVISGKSWYGEDIVPTRLQDKPKAEQYDETIDSLSIWLGEKLNQSPYKINYLLDQYGGGISDVALPMMTKQAENNVFEDKFTTDSIIKSRYPGEFYSKLDELSVNNNSEKATDEDKMKYKYLSIKSEEMGDLYKEKREIQNSDLSDKEKKEKIRSIQEKINNIAKTGLKEVNNLKISGNTVKIDGEQFYKDGEGNWTKLKEEEIEKNKNISLQTYANYKQEIYIMTQEKRKTGELTEKQSLKDTDKIQIILKSNYSNKEKTALYENYILSSQDETYPLIKHFFTDKGLNINKYLEYKTQGFESDVKDDGTVDGKSISGSKKKKVYNYIDNMEISYTQKLLLFGKEYKLEQNQRTTLANYIYNSSLKNSEKLELFGKIKGFTVYKDGTVKW